MKRHQKLLGAVALGGALALVMSGCAAGGEGGNNGGGEKETVTGADYNPQPRENLKEGGEVTFPIGEITPQMNVNHSDGTVDTATLWEWYNPQTILMTPEGDAEPNPNYLEDWTKPLAELRRVLLERMGYARFMEEAKAEILDTDTDAGGERKLVRVPLPRDEDLVCVMVRCPSTGREYVIRVPPATRSCRKAAARVKP